MNYALDRLNKLKAKHGEPETLDQLFEWVLAACQEQAPGKEQMVTGLAWSVSYREKVSNTHSCPADGETNWGCKPDKQRGYPGYSGRVWVRMGWQPNTPFTWASDMLKKTQVFPGTGGGGAYDGPWKDICSARFNRYGHKQHKDAYPKIDCYSWDLKFFHDDFPLIRELWTKNNLFKVIETNKRSVDISHYRVWNDPAIEAADLAFIEECNRIKQEERKSYA